ncbi:MAG: (Fe-S)-binding protein [Proteobacteria bacterium]|nr:(Fe-S)-binding protein [Pseudomonadota bacterium]
MLLNYLEQYKNDVSLCVKCGGCQPSCPTFEATGDESMLARGRMALVEAVIEGRLELSKGFSRRINSCLDCKACVSACPSAVPVDEIIYAAKADIALNMGCKPFTGTLPGIIALRPSLQKGLMRIMGGLKKIFYDPLPVFFPLPKALKYKGKKRLVPHISGRPFNSRAGGIHRVKEKRGRVIFYVGCATNMMHQHIGEAVLEVLNHNNIEVIVMKDEHCCGIPFLSKGDRATAEKLARKNIEQLTSAEADAIVTCCATCGSTLQNYTKWIDDKEAKRLAKKTMDIHQYLANHTEFKNGIGEVKEKVTWHDPCHLSRGQGIKDEPRDILNAIPGLEFIEMSNPCHCCGFGGEVSVQDYAMSIDIADKKIRAITGSGAETVATGCPACKIHMTDAMHHYGEERPVMHTVEYLARAYRGN